MPANDSPIVAARRQRLQAWIDAHFAGSQSDFIRDLTARGHVINQGELSGLLRNKSFGEKKAEKLEEQTGMPKGYLVYPTDSAKLTDSRLPPEPPVPSHVLGLDLAKLAAAQKFLEDLFRGEGVRFIPSEQTNLLAAVYQELITESEPNLVEMAGRFGKAIRGQGERQGAIGGTSADGRAGTGEGKGTPRAKARRG
jgi:hypothetical protein